MTKRGKSQKGVTPAKRAEKTYGTWLAKLTPREQRLEEVLDLMCRGAWLTGVTDKLLAKKWNCVPANVRQISAEANRVLRARLRETPEAKEEARAQILQTFEVIRAKAMANGSPNALRVALDAARAAGFYMGVEPAKQLEIGKRADPFEGWTVDEKLAFSRDGRRPRRAARIVAKQLASTNGNGHAPPNGVDSDEGGLH
jgi:ElaB/YqjD/DUF883 family membrane-anchored ribosome-binding protein